MGVHDFTCSVCRTPMSYVCGEATGEECGEDGIGQDQAHLDLFFFATNAAPTEWRGFAHARALRRETVARRYDWGAWEFEPSLNYRTLLMNASDEGGIWHVAPFRAGDDGSPVQLENPDACVVWAINYCAPCFGYFVAQTASADLPCHVLLAAVADHMGLRLPADKPAAVAAIRAAVAERRGPA